MSSDAATSVGRDRLGWVLVGIQAVLFAAVVAGALLEGVGPALPTSLWTGLVLVAAGAFGLVAAGRYLGAALTPNPVPNGAGLVAHGPYRLARHPIYTSVLVTCLGVAVAAGTLLSYVAVAMLAAFFEVKSRLEERWLVETYEGYAAYSSRTGKYLPGIGRRRAH